MAKYKKINEGIVDRFLERMFSYIAKDRHTAAMQDLMEKDPEFAKSYKEILKNKKKIEKRFKKMSQKEIDSEVDAVLKKQGIKRK